MNVSHRELWICLLLGGIGLLISCLLFQTQLIIYGWMPLFLTVLTVVSIGFLVAGLLIVLRGRFKHCNFPIRMSSLALGLLCLSLVSLAFTSPENSPKELLLMPVFVGFLFFPLGLVLSAFGLFIDVWVSRSLGVSQWKIYRYAVRLCCISMGLAPILALIVDSPARDLGRGFKVICTILSLISFPVVLLFNAEKYLRDR
jgi:hypothetical protein